MIIVFVVLAPKVSSSMSSGKVVFFGLLVDFSLDLVGKSIEDIAELVLWLGAVSWEIIIEFISDFMVDLIHC